MTMQAKLTNPVQDPGPTTPKLPLGSHDATWRYLGDRVDADRAYCLRFGVNQAPEPAVAPGGAWAYPLPGVQPQR